MATPHAAGLAALFRTFVNYAGEHHVDIMINSSIMRRLVQAMGSGEGHSRSRGHGVLSPSRFFQLLELAMSGTDDARVRIVRFQQFIRIYLGI
jgi:hypothetical protein